MMTVITETTLVPGQEPSWDAAFQTRLADAPNQQGWISIQVIIPLDAPNKRVIVGTWENRADWEAWHTTKVFQQSRAKMDGLQQSSGPDQWFEVVAMETASGR